MFTNEDILKLAKLSRLEIEDSEIDLYKKSLEDILEYMENIKSLDLSDVQPMVGIEPVDATMREDARHESLSQEKAFMNAPNVEQGHFAIPKVMGGN